MELKLRLQEDRKSALKSQDKPRLSAVGMILAAIKQYEVDKRVEADDAAVLAILDKMLKQRRESAEQYKSAGRDDLFAQENFEMELIKTYLPEPLSATELDALIDQVISALGATSSKEMGKVMTDLRAKVQGRADMNLVSAKVKEKLS